MILLEHVSKRYKDKIIFDDVNLCIESAGLYLITGDNGKGKSTLLNIIGGFIKAKGKVVNKYKKNMGYVFQNNFLINELTVKDNLEAFNIDVNILKEYKMEDKLKQYVHDLSMGERQRLAFIIAAREENQLILLDEVLANLDQDNSEIIINKILKLKESKIVILVSHKYDNLLKYVDGVLHIKNKKINYRCSSKENNKLIVRTNSKSKLKLEVKNNYKLYFSYLITLFILSFLIVISNYANRMIDKDISNTLDYNKFYLKQCIDTNNEGFRILKCSNPDEEKLKVLDDNKIEYGFNYDYLLLSLYNEENISVINNKNVKLSKGMYPLNYNEVLASDNYSIGDKIILKANLIAGKDKIDIYNKEMILEVVGIYNDLNFINQNKLYLDYNLLDDFYKNEMLINNGVSLYDYFYNLDIESYKYVSFTDKFIDDVKFEGITYSYYQGIKDIFIKVNDLFEYIKIVIIIFFLYLMIKIYKNKLIGIQKYVCFLMANSVSKKEVILCYLKKDILFFFITLVIVMTVLLIFRIPLLSLLDLLLLFMFVNIIFIILIGEYFSRNKISRLMLEEVW